MDPHTFRRKLQMVYTEPLQITELQYEYRQPRETARKKHKKKNGAQEGESNDLTAMEELEEKEYDKGEEDREEAAETSPSQSKRTATVYTPHSSPQLLEKCFGPLRAARSLQEVIQTATTAFDHLRPLDTHESAYLHLLPAHRKGVTDNKSGDDEDALKESSSRHGRTEEPLPCVARLILTEKKRVGFNAGVSHSTGQNETVFETQLVVRNVFGRAERLTGNATLSMTKSSAFQLQFYKPLLEWGWDKSGDVQIFQQIVNNMQHNSHIEKKRGIRVRYAFGRHALSYEWAWRRIQLGAHATEGLLKEGGHNIKSSLIHQYFVDTRDDALVPTTGFAFRFAQELAGLGGDVKFLKHEVDAQLNWPIGMPGGAALNVLLKGGTHVPLMGSPSRISDRFFLGGATSFRGFETKGIGPRFRRDAYGGDVFYFGAAHLSMPLPLNLNVGVFRTQVFAQIGNLLQIYSTSPASAQRQSQPFSVATNNFLSELKSTTRASVGVGLILRTFFGMRAELNYSVPLWMQPNDQVSNLQFGVTFQFL
jgi:outer membrane protein insertion porin family